MNWQQLKNASDEDNILKLLSRMNNEDDRGASFWCAMVFVRYASDPEPIIVEKSWEGQILRELKAVSYTHLTLPTIYSV